MGKPDAVKFIAKNNETERSRKRSLRNPTQSTLSQRERNQDQSLSKSFWKLRMREYAEASAHSTEKPVVRLTPAPKIRGDPSINFKHLVTKDHIPHVRTWSVFMNDGMWAVLCLSEEGENQENSGETSQNTRFPRQYKPDCKISQTLLWNSLEFIMAKLGKQNLGSNCLCWSHQ